MSSFHVTFSVVVYNSKLNDVLSLLNCIDAVTLNYHIYLIDNSSTDQLKNFVEKISNLTYYYTGKNIGYGRGHNVAINKLIQSTKYHVILNPDITFQPGTIECIYSFMENNPDIGHVMPKVLYEDGRVQRLCKLLPKPYDLISRRFFATIRWPKKIPSRYELNDFNYEKVFDVPSLSGCFMFLRFDILKKIEGFDPRFFLYLEDFDLTRRVHEISRTVYYPHAEVVHRFEKASYNNPKMLKLHVISAVKYFNKWGWFFDKKRKLYNTYTLMRLRRLYLDR